LSHIREGGKYAYEQSNIVRNIYYEILCVALKKLKPVEENLKMFL
jgi:hypothetical protein